ncbi:MAG TPA: hypothetical protein PLQ97_13435 [Myxococcota bacterium]|nr:hypothetical protein [Myxococcota bacterium]HQK52229.1 hypothetical protein [Myxococcota bacterium]
MDSKKAPPKKTAAPKKAPTSKTAAAPKTPARKPAPTGTIAPLKFEKFIAACLMDDVLRGLLYEAKPATDAEYKALVEKARARMTEMIDELKLPPTSTRAFIKSLSVDDFRDFAEAARKINDINVVGA